MKAVLAQPDTRFCIVNSTIGLHSVSSAFDTNIAIARGVAGLLVGTYAWGCPYNSDATTPNHSDPAGEAAWYLQRVNPQIGELVSYDDEENDASDWPTRLAYALTWLPIVGDAKGAKPLHYMNWDRIINLRSTATVAEWERLCDFPVWLADPTGVPGQHEPVDPKPGSTKTMTVLVHQYGTVNGIDANYTPDLAALKACAVTK